ncbi:MAG: cytochrome c biogenesis protein ResB [Candidatus Sericytochromatia bacterium]|nr:cytochrome c biogenesis protein ResB [Candidatus Sericytochromatia bacterium]
MGVLNGWRREFLHFFGSLKLAIVLLLAIAAASMVGTVIPQDQGPSVIESAAFAAWLKTALLSIQAYDVYHAAWFLGLLALLFVNLAVCTYLRFPPTWRRYRLQRVPAPAVSGLLEVQRLVAPPDPLRLDSLRKRGWNIQIQGDDLYFAEKNKFVRMAPTFIHLSLFLIIAGGIWGGLVGIKHSLPVMVGESLSSDQIVETAYQKGRLHATPSPFDVRLDAFRMEFRPSGMVKQYYSDVTVTPRDGRPPFQKTLWVNEPLVHDGFYFYQSFWGVGAVTWQRAGREEKQKLTQAKTGGYMSAPFTLGGQSLILFLRSLEEPAILLQIDNLQPVAQVVPGLAVEVAGQPFMVSGYHLYSGLETKTDPGIPLVYLGCGFLIFGLVLLPFRHCEVWVRRDDAGWLMGGRTHRGRVMLKRELLGLAHVWNTLESRGVDEPAGVRA